MVSVIRMVLIGVVVAAAAVAALGGPSDRWLDAEATVRRIVTCEPTATGLPGDDVAVVTFYTGGLAARDGKDVRVFAASAEPRLVPHRVIMEGPGDRLRIAFATPPGVRRYHVYYGNPGAGAPAEVLDVRRGVLYEVRAGEASNAVRVDQIQRAFSRAAPQGAAFVDNIFFGFNPFGPSEGYLSHFVGYLNIKRPGEYRIATTSDDCSFVLIDDKPVIGWGGVHGAVADARHNAPVMLGRGLHKLDYWHAQGGGGTVAEAAWRLPGRDRFEVIPKEAFAPVAFAALEEIQIKGQRISPDFIATRAGESFHDDFYPVRVEFQNLSSPGKAPNMTCQWDFGDGQTSTEQSPSHVYLRHGTYKVRLTVTWGPQKASVTNSVVVERNWWKQSMNVIEPLRAYAKVAAAYDFAKLDAASLVHAVDLFNRAGRTADRRRALETLIFKASGVTERDMWEHAEQLAELCRRDRRHDDAVKVYRRAEAAMGSARGKAAAAIASGRVFLDDLNRAAEAEGEFRRALKDYASAPRGVLRDARIGVGDVACKRGDSDAAMKAYREAEKIPVGGLASKNPTLRVSSLARYVEEYIRTRDFDSAEEFIQTWYREFPSHRVRGQAPLMEARLEFARERYDKVMQVAGDLVSVNRDSAFAPEVLFLSAEAALQLDRRDDARRSLAQIVDDYPEFHRHNEAAELLKKLGGPPEASGPR